VSCVIPVVIFRAAGSPSQTRNIYNPGNFIHRHQKTSTKPMASKKKLEQVELSAETLRMGKVPWPARTGFEVGKTRRQRQAQYKQQIKALLSVLGVTLVFGFVFILSNWNNAGSTQPISCAAYPTYCLPLGGGSTEFTALEAASSRTLDANSTAASGVERYIDVNNIATLGDPQAPIHFVVVSDFACSHCQDYHDTDMPRFINDYVLTGQATFGLVMVTGTGGVYSQTASEAALCAGEQGGFWEMGEEFFRQASSRGVDQAFVPDQISSTAKDLGLDSKKLIECLTSNRYGKFMQEYQTFSVDHGVSGTPTLLASYGDANQWNAVSRDYNTLKQLTETTNKP
jgi:protein-disulfide isomerase